MASDIVVSYVLKHKYYVEILEYERKPQRNVTLKLILKYRDESMILRTEHARTEQNADHDIFSCYNRVDTIASLHFTSGMKTCALIKSVMISEQCRRKVY